MLAIIDIVAPVFGLLGLGFLAARLGYLPEAASRMIAEFAFKVAMPALLFRAMLAIGTLPGSPWQLVATYAGAVVIVWIATSISTLLFLRRPAIDAPAIAMGACFGNTVMLGVPLALTAFGADAAAPVALLISIDTPMLWIIATLHMEAARRSGEAVSGSIFKALRDVLFDLLRNPIVLPLIAGTLWRFTDLGIPKIADRLLELLAGAAVPTALFSLGMSLAAYEIKGQTRTLSLIILMKMVALPAAVYALATWVFPLPPLWTAIALLFAALPVGANAFLFAMRYERAVHSVSAAIAVSTAIAVVTIAVILYFLRTMVG
jgi:malonate transporter and related proteins